MCFLKAIAIERGLIAGNAKDAYEAGVRSNMAEFDIPEAVITDYLASTAPNYYGTTAKYDDTTGDCNTHMDKILTQNILPNSRNVLLKLGPIIASSISLRLCRLQV